MNLKLIRNSLLISFIILLFSTNSYAQELLLGWGIEIDIHRIKYQGQTSGSRIGETYTYNLDISKTVASLSWSSFKIGYLAKNNIYVSLHGSIIMPTLEDGKIIKDNLWEGRQDISANVYGNGYIDYKVSANYKYSRFFNLEAGYDFKFLLPEETNFNLIGGVGMFVHDRYFGEVTEAYRRQYYAIGEQNSFTYIEGKEYETYSKVAFSAKVLALYKNFYLDVSIGGVNSIGFGYLLRLNEDDLKK